MYVMNFDLWVSGCCEANKIILYCLEGHGDTALYKTQKEYWVKNNRAYTDPVYHVWWNGKRKYCGMNIKEAYQIWEWFQWYKAAQEFKVIPMLERW